MVSVVLILWEVKNSGVGGENLIIQLLWTTGLLFARFYPYPPIAIAWVLLQGNENVLIASTKIPERKGSISLFRFYGQLPDCCSQVLLSYLRSGWRKWGRGVGLK